MSQPCRVLTVYKCRLLRDTSEEGECEVRGKGMAIALLPCLALWLGSGNKDRDKWSGVWLVKKETPQPFPAGWNCIFQRFIRVRAAVRCGWVQEVPQGETCYVDDDWPTRVFFLYRK